MILCCSLTSKNHVELCRCNFRSHLCFLKYMSEVGHRCLTGFGVDVRPQNVPTRNVLQSESFGYARRHRSFPRPRRSHNDCTKNLIKCHLWILISYEHRGRVLPMKALSGCTTAAGSEQVHFLFQESAQRSQEWARLLQSVSTLTGPWRLFPCAPQKPREEEEEVEEKEEDDDIRDQHSASGGRWGCSENERLCMPCWQTWSPVSLFTVYWRCIYCITRLCNWSTGGQKLGKVAVINPFRASILSADRPADWQAGCAEQPICSLMFSIQNHFDGC